MPSPSAERTPEPDLAQMERWTAWVIRLTSHAASQTIDPAVRHRLEGATEDAQALREAVAAAASGWLDEGQVAVVRSVYELWDANHDRMERLASVIDPMWHRRWRLRSAGARPELLPAAMEHDLHAVG